MRILAPVPVGALLAAPVVTSLVAPSAASPPPTAAPGAGPAVATLALSAAPTAATVRYGRDIRPILSDRCFNCHGPDAGTRKAGLRLDLPESALGTAGAPGVIVPGHPEQSELWRRLESHDPDEVMPPPDSGKRPLGPGERALIRAWIDAGAVYEPHWSFVPPVRPEVPTVSDRAWCRTTVDRFVLAALEQRGIRPSPEADRATLARRLFLDLTGLPPTPEEIAAFIADARPDAYERLVDTLLETEPYRSRHAERMAVPWLDAARYADTSGIHMDAGRQMWLWRDWVLDAYRDNLPFDRFLRDQLAGDLVAAGEADASGARPLEPLVASGFHRNHVTSDEGGAIDEEYLVEYAVDRAATTASVFLGLTLSCARCHDHKYDPISQEDFYRFLAFFNSVEEPGIYSQSTDANRALEPFLAVPTEAQRLERAEIVGAVQAAREQLDAPTPDEDDRRRNFLAAIPTHLGLHWRTSEPIAATSTDGATLSIQPDGSVLASGPNPPQDEQVITVRTDAADLRVLLLEAIPDPSMPHGRVGRAENGNVVLTGISAEAVSMADRSRREPVRFSWAWADIAQQDGDYGVGNVLDLTDDRGWAVGAHQAPGGRALLVLSDRPFGFEGGTELRVRLQYRSPYTTHVFGRLRLHLASMEAGAALEAGQTSEATMGRGLALLPIGAGAWHVVGPFPSDNPRAHVDIVYGPEEGTSLERGRNFGFGNQYWRPEPRLADDRLNTLAQGVNTTYVGRELYVPSARKAMLSLGSDDGVRVFLNGREVFARNVERALARDQDRVQLDLAEGANTVVLKIVNTGGNAGFHWRLDEPTGDAVRALPHDLVAAALPDGVGEPSLAARAATAWRMTFLPEYRERRDRLAALERRVREIDAAAPQTMVMRERPQPRETFVLMRGQYDHPDRQRPVAREVPAALGALDADAPRDRLGLARWLTSPNNPLVARVAVNRLWEMLLGNGLVRTSEDFGLQGEWPSHPELLDWLAVEFRDPQDADGPAGSAAGPWDVRHIIRLIVNSSTYRQSSVVRPELRETDPDNRLLAAYPRRRLGAEQLRDQALFAAGLLVERLGGPSVKPYQPDGLWQEVAMPGSNTRVYVPGKGEENWRRSLYTYWKRAAPPPSMLTLDAPTREFCTIRRPSTSTPLQALVLWNDVQFVEAARVLAQRTLGEAVEVSSDPALRDAERLRRLFVRCTGREPDERERTMLASALAEWRVRYGAAAEDAAALLAIGEAPRPSKDSASEIPAAELAAWTMIASSVLSLHATNTQG